METGWVARVIIIDILIAFLIVLKEIKFLSRSFNQRACFNYHPERMQIAQLSRLINCSEDLKLTSIAGC